MVNHPDDRFKRVPEAALARPISERTIWRMLADGELTRCKARGCTLVDLDELDERIRNGSFSREFAA